MNKGEKPKHSYWTEGAFIEKRNDKGKLIAKCKVYNKILQNTAINRLKDHRKECRYESPSNLDTPDQNHADDDNNNESTLNDHSYVASLRKNPKIACKDD
ncbi:unnamed protein product [Lasius platythorax]|uniref:BED-type domain-containing protein n=1 Tax=Lasius platythorax TaxID=488582 RepID=A0AAV2MZ31_9HYME